MTFSQAQAAIEQIADESGGDIWTCCLDVSAWRRIRNHTVSRTIEFTCTIIDRHGDSKRWDANTLEGLVAMVRDDLLPGAANPQCVDITTC